MTAPEVGIPLTDDALPGLGLVTDPARLSAWLSAQARTDLRVAPRRLRYKPGVSLVMAVDVLPADAPEGDPATRPCLVRTYSARAADKVRKTLEVAPADSVLGHDREALLVVTTAAGDRDLPLLARLAEPDGLRTVVERLLPDRPELASARVRTLRHNPERRWVGVLETGEAPVLLLRGYPGRETRRHARAYAAVAGGPPRTPTVLGSSRSLGVAVVEWVPGRELAASTDRSEWLAGGSTIAQLHGRGHVPLKHVSSRDEAAKVREAADLVARLMPGMADEVIALADEVRHGLRALDRERRPVHGDFSADQVVVTPDGGTALVDLDRAHLGDPAADLGCAVAEVMIRAEEDGDVGRGRRLAATLVEGYASERRPPTSATIATHALAFRLRKAAEPFRACRPDWRARVAARFERARAAHQLLHGGGWG